MESLLDQPSFYRRFGIRKAEQLMSPPLPRLELLDLPKDAILHFQNVSPISIGPTSDEFLFRNIKRPIMMFHVLEGGDNKGIPRRLPVAPDSLIRKYHVKNRRFKQVKDVETGTRDQNTLMVYNYGLLPQLYRYTRSFYTEYYKWWNTEAAVWKTIAEAAEVSNRHHYLVCKLPKVLPSISTLKQATGPMTQKLLKLFDTPEALMLLELWKWFGEERKDSVLNFLPEKHFDKVDLIFQESGRWFVLNLGKMNSWRKTTKEEIQEKLDKGEIKDAGEANKKGLEADQLQRRFLRLTVSLFQVRTNQNIDDNLEEEATTGQTGTEVVKNQTNVPITDKDSGKVEVKTTTTPIKTVPTAAEEGPDDTADTIKHDEALDKQIEADLAELEKISSTSMLDDEGKKIQPDLEIEKETPYTLERGVAQVCDRLADDGLLSAAEYRRYNELAKTYKTLRAPDGSGTLEQFIQIPPEIVKIKEAPVLLKDNDTVTDKSMLKSTLKTMDSSYIKNVLHKDVAGMVLGVQDAGIAVTGYDVEKEEDVMGASLNYSIRVNPVEGAACTLRFKLPVVDDDGVYVANGVKYRMRKQRGDLPIRKISPNTVALTSYYGKVFARRSEKRVNDYGQWIRNSIMAMGLDNENINVTRIQPSDVFVNDYPCPKLFSSIAMGFRGFTLMPAAYPRSVGQVMFEMNFDATKHEEAFGKEAIAEYEKDGSVICGTNAKGQYLVMDKNETFYVGQDGNLSVYGTIEELLGLDAMKAPVEFAELKVMGKAIPIGVILGYELGLEKLMKFLKVEPRRVPAGSRLNMGSHEYALVFSDETLIFSKDDALASMILSGFNEFHKGIRNYSVYEFDKRGVYLNVLETGGIGVRFLRELDLLYQMFVDPITRELLVEMKEPTEFRGLLMRCCELLLSDQHPHELDPAYMRIKGYERMAGAVYSELVKSIRAHRGLSGKNKAPIDLNPYAVWKNIAQDPSIALVSDINPINNLKETEAVTYGGVGGRSSRSMTKHTRQYHNNDMGTISESTVDSSDVGINIFTSANPQFDSLRGTTTRYKKGETGPASMLSTSALLAPGVDMDDPKRAAFVSIQNSHSVACEGYTQPPVRTGYEQVVAHRTGDLFATTADKAGKVLSVTDTGIIVEFEDGSTKGIEIGRRYGNAAGLTIPHNVVSKLKEGQKFKAGEVLAYNDGFFEEDFLNPGNVVLKSGIMVKTALIESTITLEDSSAISKRISEKMTTKMTKVKNVVVGFKQNVHKIVKPGSAVESEDILCIIEDEITSNTDLFDQESLDTLRILGAQTPQAKSKGVVERIEVYYHGEKEDMSDTLRALATASDREMAKRNKSAGRSAFTGSVTDNFRIEGDPLALDTVCIRFYITTDAPMGVGDKCVFSNQLKSVVGGIMSNDVKTESGIPIDAVFSSKGVYDRIVNSAFVIGTTATLLSVIEKKAVALYKS